MSFDCSMFAYQSTPEWGATTWLTKLSGACMTAASCKASKWLLKYFFNTRVRVLSGWPWISGIVLTVRAAISARNNELALKIGPISCKVGVNYLNYDCKQRENALWTESITYILKIGRSSYKVGIDYANNNWNKLSSTLKGITSLQLLCENIAKHSQT